MRQVMTGDNGGGCYIYLEPFADDYERLTDLAWKRGLGFLRWSLAHVDRRFDRIFIRTENMADVSAWFDN